MKLKITYVPAEAEPQKEIRWQDLPRGTVYECGYGKSNSCVSLVCGHEQILNLTTNGEINIYVVAAGQLPVKRVLGQLSGLEITRGEQ